MRHETQVGGEVVMEVKEEVVEALGGYNLDQRSHRTTKTWTVKVASPVGFVGR